jgi:branched-chain amino acid transport system substrate-binding protein
LSPRAQKVWERIKAKENLKDPSELVLPSGTANSYDAVYIIAEALKIAGSYDKTKLRDAFYQVKYEGIIANYNPAFERTAERHDAILPAHYKLLAYHKGILLPVAQTPHALRF